MKPLWSSGSFVAYFGTFVALLSAIWLLGVLADDNGAFVFFVLAALATAVAAALAFGLRARDQALAAGLLAVVTAVVATIFVGAFLDLVGLAPEDGELLEGFSLGRLLLEIAFVVISLFLLAAFRFPLLVLWVALGGWILVADAVTNGGDRLAVVSILWGLLYAGIGVAVPRPYGMWLHVGAGLLVGGGLLNFLGDGDGGWFLVLLVGLAYIAVADLLDRSSYAVLGTLGVFAAVTHFVDEWFDLPDPLGVVFGGESVEVGEIGRPLVYVAVGLGFIALGMALDRGRRSSSSSSSMEPVGEPPPAA